MSTFRTLNERRTLSDRPELFRTPRTRREAGIGQIDKSPPAEFLAVLKAELEGDDDAPTGAAIVWAAACALVVVVGLLAWVAA